MLKNPETILKDDPLRDEISSIELIDYMGSELSVVNDARVSYRGHSDELNEKDIKLIKYLYDHKHTSPFRSIVFKFRVKAPLFVARQWFKHTIASSHLDEQNSWNEVSLRYTEVKEPEFYIPKEFYSQSFSNKQKSAEKIDDIDQPFIIEIYRQSCQKSFDSYQKLISKGVSREMARGVLPTSTYTTWIWTCSLQALLHFLDLRDHKAAQTEISLYAASIKKLVGHIIPNILKIFSVE